MKNQLQFILYLAEKYFEEKYFVIIA